MNNKYALGTGRRKSSVATVRLKESDDNSPTQITINHKPGNNYLLTEFHVNRVLSPIRLCWNDEHNFDIKVKVTGGGYNGQTDAIKLAIAKAIVQFNPDTRPMLRSAGMLTTDARRVEPKRYGHVKSRAKQAFKKR